MSSFDFSKCAAFNLPNRLTMMRFVLAIIFFAFLSYRWYDIAFFSYILAWITDWLDGYMARKKGLLTDFGRIADPFVDKIIVCGGFILLIQHKAMTKLCVRFSGDTGTKHLKEEGFLFSTEVGTDVFWKIELIRKLQKKNGKKNTTT